MRETTAVFFSFFDPITSVVEPDPEIMVSCRIGSELSLSGHGTGADHCDIYVEMLRKYAHIFLGLAFWGSDPGQE
jgi:hypothetical protein